MPHARLVLALLLLAIPARGADVTPEARKLLDDVAKAYKALPAYADKGEVTLTYRAKPGAEPVKQTTPASVALVRPNKVAIDAGVVRIVSDGKVMRTITPPFKMYRDVPATAKLTLAEFADGPLGSVETGSPQGLPLHLVMEFLLADDPVKTLVDDARSIKALTLANAKGTPHTQVIYEPQVGPTLTIVVEDATKLIDRIDVAVSQDGSASLVPNSSLAVESLSWSAGTITTKGVPDDRFSMVRPDGFSEIAKLEKDVARKKAEHELMGEPAPDFRLNVLDGPGKTKRVAKADLAGKVVLLDFWATWCGPCMAEMPDIARLIEGYAKAGKPVVVVAVSIDQAEDGGDDEIRTKVEKTLKAKELDLQVSPVGRVALDSSLTVARAFKAEAIPQLVLIDAKGVVRHVHIGVTERDTLTGEIDGLLGEVAKP
ncbi:MAG TPA: TlpA disulfide reductase family protein [Isosphaeraceae bacterium]